MADMDPEEQGPFPPSWAMMASRALRRWMMDKSRIVGLDPGLRSTGWVDAMVDGDQIIVEDWGVIRTPAAPSRMHQKTLVRTWYAQKLREALHPIVWQGSDYCVADAVMVEAPMMHPRSGLQSAHKKGITWGVVVSACSDATNVISIWPASPVTIRIHLLGRKSGSKDEVFEAARERVTGDLPELDVPKTYKEHARDALAVVVAGVEAMKEPGRMLF